MNTELIQNPIVLHLARGFVFLVIVFAAFGLLRRRTLADRLAGPFWRVVILLLGLLAVVELLPGWWIVDFASPPGESAPPAQLESLSAASNSGTAEYVQAAMRSTPPITASRIGFVFATLWITGLAVVILRWIAGRIQLARLRRRSLRIEDPSDRKIFECARSDLGITREVHLLESSSIDVPLTWGVISPVILMPVSARRWETEERRMAFLHELGHVRGRDAAFQLLTRVVAALHWMNPLAWISCRRLAFHQETDADRMALEAGVSPSHYAEFLLRLAENRPAIPAVAAHAAISMSRPSSVPKRVESILAGDSSASEKRGIRRAERFAVSFLLATASIALGVTTVAVTAADPPAPDPPANEPEMEPELLYTKAYAVQPRPADDQWSKEYLEKIGIEFSPGATCIYNPTTSQLIMRNTGAQMKIFEDHLSRIPRGRFVNPGDGDAAEALKPNPIEEKLKRITIPSVAFNDAPLTECIEFLRQVSVELDTKEPDPRKRGINIVVRDKKKPHPALPSDPGITLKLTNVPLGESLRYVVALANRTYKIDGSVIVIEPKEPKKTRN